MHIDLLGLLSGSDVRGYAIEEEGAPAVDLTNEAALKVAYAFADWYEKNKGEKLKRVAVGRDPRLSGENLAQAVSLGLIAQGVNVFDTGLATTPAMFMITQDPNYNVDASIMITASHLPMNRNGLKLITKSGGLSSAEVREILEIGEDIITSMAGGAVRKEIDYLPEYAAQLVERIRERTGEERPLEGLKVIVDAGNGGGGFFVERVLKPLGADTTGSLFLEPDGSFPNHIPNPEDKTALESIKEVVRDNQADMGIIFDTDVDRAAIIDENGNPIAKSDFIAFISSLLLEENPGATIVTDSVTSNALTDYIEHLGGKHLRYKRGYNNVISKAKELQEAGENAVLAMETSGHGAVKDNYFLDDGAYLAALSLIALAKMKSEGKKISEILEDYDNSAIESERRVPVPPEKMDSVLEDFLSFGENQPGWSKTEPNYEGVRFDVGDNWILLRKSLHDPLVVVTMQAQSEEELANLEATLDKFIEEHITE